MKPVDPRAGKLCSNCNAAKQVTTDAPAPRPHCESPDCTWWRCRRCGAVNDAQGRNDTTNLAGERKDGTRR